MRGAVMDDRNVIWRGPRVHTWAEFSRVVKRPGRRLLARIDSFSRPILIAGCQRSGTTAVARLVSSADGMGDFRFGDDDELDAALILAGQVETAARGRLAFQTTYLNDRFREYFEHDDFRLVWVVREPLSVVRSMLHHWRRAALNRLYVACGAPAVPRAGNMRARTPRSLFPPSRLEKACASYVGKVGQTFELVERLAPERMIVVDYDELVLHKEALLPAVFEFLDLPYRPELGGLLHARSVNKGRLLPAAQAAYVEETCRNVYERAREARLRAREAAA
ncbi:MAG: sulfotransferase [Gammaproteobacteria bacterium]|nr:hypothetical protein [Gammaproteobacteria bacterium]